MMLVEEGLLDLQADVAGYLRTTVVHPICGRSHLGIVSGSSTTTRVALCGWQTVPERTPMNACAALVIPPF